MKTWVLSLALVVTAIVGFACGGDSATPTTQPTATSPAPTATSPAMVDPTATSPAPTATSTAMVDPTATSPATGGEATLEINGSDDLKFDESTFSVAAGSAVTLTLHNTGASQLHNWVLVQDGTKDAVAAAGLTAPTTNWLSPDDANVIANTSLTAAGESTQLTFTAPAAGTYQFVCTFPGHAPTMFGTFEVTP